MKIYLDPGHGGSDPGAIGHGMKEKDIVLDIAQRIKSRLSNYKHITIRLSRTNDVTKTLSQRTGEANSWGADYFISIHCNAFNGNAKGYEDYVYNRLSDSSAAVRYRHMMHQEIVKVNGLLDRGKKKANFHILRETAMPAFLSENGFIDSQKDTSFMKHSYWRDNIALGHVNGILKVCKAISPLSIQKNKRLLYKVIVGSFQSKEKANKRKLMLETNGISTYIYPTYLSGKKYYRVQVGVFANRSNAEKYKEMVGKVGIDAIIIHS